MRIAIYAAAALLSGCAMTYDAVQTGPNRYQASAVAYHARGGWEGAQKMAMEAAGKKCVSMGKNVNAINVEDHWVYPAATGVIVTFECD